jgi:hypothetical protein
MAKTTTKTRAGVAARRKATMPNSGGDVRALARDAAVAALTRLAELANSEDERVALAASQELLNRAFGKSPPATADDQSGAARPLVIRIIRFGAEAPEGMPAEIPAKPGRNG